MLTLQLYDLAVSYVPGKYMYLAGTLSRAYIKGEPESPLDEEMSRVIHSLVKYTTVSAAKMDEICEPSDADLTLYQVKCLILDGWPKSIKSIPVKARAYWNVRDELHIADGVIFFGECVVVALQLRNQMLRIIHKSHLGAEKCKARARTVLYWPIMGNDIEQVVAKCSVCMKFKKKST